MVMLATQEPYFPVYAEMPETKRHLEQRTLLYQVLKLAFGDRAAVGCDQFVYWDRSDPRLCLAPDAFVCLGETNDLFPSWKVWSAPFPKSPSRSSANRMNGLAAGRRSSSVISVWA
jgi:hypothetical protein